MQDELSKSFLRLAGIMDELREKCPWDKKQTIHTLRPQTIEETYELTDAIVREDWKGIKEELGDVMLHLLFYSKIASEQGKFTLKEVLEGVSDKLVARHPHIYGDVQVNNEEEVKRNWENLKLKEGKKSVLEGVPRSMPALVKAMRLQEKAKQVGFEWENADQVWEKVEEEMGELKEAVTSGDQLHTEEELGDLFFSLINYARFLQLDPENALERTNRKFITRFQAMENRAGEQGKALTDMSLTEMDAIWNSVKNDEPR